MDIKNLKGLTGGKKSGFLIFTDSFSMLLLASSSISVSSKLTKSAPLSSLILGSKLLSTLDKGIGLPPLSNTGSKLLIVIFTSLSAPPTKEVYLLIILSSIHPQVTKKSEVLPLVTHNT